MNSAPPRRAFVQIVSRASAPGSVGKERLIKKGDCVMEEIVFLLMWVGQACFVMQSGETTIVTDPVPARLGYSIAQVDAQIVTMSHNHADHTYLEMVKGEPIVLRGLSEDGKDWIPVDKTEKGVRVKMFPTYHDDTEGAKRGKNNLTLFEIRGLRILHTGDLGHMLDDKTIEAIGRVDILLICVGGYYTIDADQARALIEKIKPRVAVPMHYKTDPKSELPISSNAEFLKGWKNVKTIDEKKMSFTASLAGYPEGETTILVLPPHPAADDKEKP
jgi:L-ascorbate metabolism protein UlaG (beta-lactamase superfamily)